MKRIREGHCEMTYRHRQGGRFLSVGHAVPRTSTPCFVVALLLGAWGPAYADLPLTIEDLLADKGKTKLELSLAYANADRQGVVAADPITVQTGPTSFVTIPSRFGITQGNTDTVVTTLGLRYGIAVDTEIYTRANHVRTSNRDADMSGTRSLTESRFADARIGVNHQFKPDTDTPAVLGFAEATVRERATVSSATLKSGSVGATTYHAIDPVVLSLTAAYSFHRTRLDGAARYKPGNALIVNPSMAFAINDRITTTTGLQWSSRQADHYDGVVRGFRRTSTDLLLGLGYGFAKGNAVNFSFKLNASGRNGADLGINWLSTL